MLEADDMPDSVTVQALGARDGYGKPSWGAKRTIRCRVGARKARDGEGVVSSEPALITTASIENGERVWLPGTDSAVDAQGVTARVTEAQDDLDPAGVRIYVVTW